MRTRTDYGTPPTEAEARWTLAVRPLTHAVVAELRAQAASARRRGAWAEAEAREREAASWEATLSCEAEEVTR